MKNFIVFLMALPLLLIACSKDNPTQPVQQGTLLLSRVSVTMIPGGTETVAVWALDKAGQRDTCTITCDDAGIISASISDSTISITGNTVGICNVTVRGGSGRTRVLPVEVYDPNILETDGLIIKYTTTFNSVWDAPGLNFSLWRPIPSEGFYPLGTFGIHGLDRPAGMMTVKAAPGSDAMALSVGYDTVVASLISMWRPIPPPGYVAMGMVMTTGFPGGMPGEPMACIREDLAIPAALDTVYVGVGYGFWSIIQPDAGPHDQAYLSTGACIFVNGTTDPPAVHPALNVFKVNLPMLVEAPSQDITPHLTSFEAPPMETVPGMKKGLLAPFSVITDQIHNDDWQAANSGVYNLERQVFYKCIFHKYNQTSVPEANEVELISGLSTTETERIWGEIGVEMSAEAGVSIGVATAKVTATVSVSLGYERQTSITQFVEKHVTNIVNTPPGKASALWQQYNRFTLYRHNGNRLEQVGSYEVGIDSYVTDEYPD